MKKISGFIFGFILIGLCQAAVWSQTTEKKMNVAIFIFDNVQIVDFTGPYEVFGGAPAKSGSGGAFNVYTVAEKPGSIKTSMGMSVNPSYSFENAPKTDILVIPGGGALAPNSPGVNAQVKNPAVIKWVQDSARDAKIVLSVCNGAFIIAQAGLLDGLEATTTAGDYIKALRKQYPKIRTVFDDKRFVDNGKVVTTAGLSSGFDGSIHVVEKLFGRVIAKLTALGMEYNWDPESKYARAALADKNIPQSIYEAFYSNETELLDFDGSVNDWEEDYSTLSVLSPAEMIKKIDEKLATEANWTKDNIKVSAKSDAVTSWKFTDEKGQSWNATATVQPGKEKNQLLIVLKVFRAS